MIFIAEWREFDSWSCGKWVGMCPDHPLLHAYSSSPAAALEGIKELVEMTEA